jgi:transposase-like protein
MIFMMARQKSGVSMLSLQRMLGIRSYKTVWTMGHKIRKAMEDRDSQYQLAGLVEMDDAFIGPRKPGPPGRGAIGKSKVVIAVESRDKHAGFAVMQHVPAVDSDQIFSIAQDKIQPASDVRTDGWRAYQTLGSKGFVHEPVIVSKDKQALKQLKWVHVMIANMKGNYEASTTGSARSTSVGIWRSSHTGLTDVYGIHNCSIVLLSHALQLLQ